MRGLLVLIALLLALPVSSALAAPSTFMLPTARQNLDDADATLLGNGTFVAVAGAAAKAGTGKLVMVTRRPGRRPSARLFARPPVETGRFLQSVEVEAKPGGGLVVAYVTNERFRCRGLSGLWVMDVSARGRAGRPVPLATTRNERVSSCRDMTFAPGFQSIDIELNRRGDGLIWWNEQPEEIDDRSAPHGEYATRSAGGAWSGARPLPDPAGFLLGMTLDSGGGIFGAWKETRDGRTLRAAAGDVASGLGPAETFGSARSAAFAGDGGGAVVGMEVGSTPFIPVTTAGAVQRTPGGPICCGSFDPADFFESVGLGGRRVIVFTRTDGEFHGAEAPLGQPLGPRTVVPSMDGVPRVGVGPRGHALLAWESFSSEMRVSTWRPGGAPTTARTISRGQSLGFPVQLLVDRRGRASVLWVRLSDDFDNLGRWALTSLPVR